MNQILDEMEKLLGVASGVTMATFRAKCNPNAGGRLEMIKWWETEFLSGMIPAW